MLRPQSPGPLAHDAAFEVPGSRWASVADDTEFAGFAVITEAKYGYGARSGLLHCSLIRSARVTGHAGSGTGNAAAGAGRACSDLGPHTVRLAFGPTSADAPRAEQPATLADTLFTPVVEASGRPATAGLVALRGGDSLTAAWAKPASASGGGHGGSGGDDGGSGGGFTLRLHETLGRRGTAELELEPGLTAERVDLRGSPAPGTKTADGPRVAVPFRPYELVSLRVRPA